MGAIPAFICHIIRYYAKTNVQTSGWQKAYYGICYGSDYPCFTSHSCVDWSADRSGYSHLICAGARHYLVFEQAGCVAILSADFPQLERVQF